MVIERSDAVGDGADEGKGEDDVHVPDMRADDVSGYVKQSLRCRNPDVVVP
jgi:hypothetical protein